MQTQIDHLVVAARDLDQGVAWARQTLGVTPGPGGAHARFGTHNRLLKIATPAFPWAYLEIIAIQPGAPGPLAPGRRWFDLDDPRLQSAVHDAPQLVHVVAQTDDIQAAREAWARLGLERGPVVAASRATPAGVLQWQITVREDGQRLMGGALPTLIQWGAQDDAQPMRLHPRNSLSRSGVALHALALAHPQADLLQAACEAVGLGGLQVTEGPAGLSATLRTPKGRVTLRSPAL